MYSCIVTVLVSTKPRRHFVGILDVTKSACGQMRNQERQCFLTGKILGRPVDRLM